MARQAMLQARLVRAQPLAAVGESETSIVRNWIKSALSKRMTPQESRHRHHWSAKNSVTLHGFSCVLRATRHKAARWRQPGWEHPLISAQQCE